MPLNRTAIHLGAAAGVVAAVICAVATVPSRAASPDSPYWPDQEGWASRTPAELGFEPPQLAEATSPSQELNESYGYLCWLNGQPSYQRPAGGGVKPGPMWPDVPPDAFDDQLLGRICKAISRPSLF